MALNEPSTDIGSGEGIQVKGHVRRATSMSPDDFVKGMNSVEVAVNIAGAINECRYTKAAVLKARADRDAALKEHNQATWHLRRLQRRMEEMQTEATEV